MSENNETTQDKHMESIAYLPKDKAERLLKFLQYSGISDSCSTYDELSDSYHVEVPSALFEKADNLYHIFSENELNEDNNIEDTVNSLYETSTEKYKDNLSSAITFFICGFAGLIILILNNVGVFKFINTSGPSGILMNIVLGALFIGFIVIAVFSLKYSKKIKNQAEKESEINNKISVWLSENVSEEDIENSYNHNIPLEMKYFSRSEYIQNAIRSQFNDIDDSIIESITDNYIEQLFS